MIFHWMENRGPLSYTKIQELTKSLDDAGFYSALFTFHAMSPDYIVTSAAALNKNEKIKYMFAIRPFHMSYQYLSMVTESFNRICNNRIIINFVNGVDGRDDEKEHVDINNKLILNVEDRRKFVRNFVQEYKDYGLVKNIPRMVFSGDSSYVFETAHIYDSDIMIYLDSYLQSLHKYKNYSKKIIALRVLARDTDAEAENDIKKILAFKGINCIYGSKETVAKKLLDLKEYNIPEIMIVTFVEDQRWENSIDAVKIALKN